MPRMLSAALTAPAPRYPPAPRRASVLEGSLRLTHLVAFTATAVAAVAVGLLVTRSSPDAAVSAPSPAVTSATPTAEPAGPSPSPSSAPSAPPPPSPDPTTGPEDLLGTPWGLVTGLLQFRGNPTHTWYGTGPIPRDPAVAWRYPDRPMCSEEVVGEVTETRTEPGPDGSPTTTTTTRPEIKEWCGTGWTGQPVVWERPDGMVEMIVGAYDGAIHFIDTATGTPTRTPFQTGQMIKGTVTLDPDGYPLLYAGSRDNFFRIIALDREQPTELWRMHAHDDRVWNNDWDGNPSVIDDVLYVGGEDSWFYALRLHRGYDADGQVTVGPETLIEMPGWSDELVADVGDHNVSIESSVAVDVERNRAYFANSGGRVVGLDVSRIGAGEAPVVFDYWVGDDVDASIVVDPDGSLYVTVEHERGTARAAEVGQLVKLDPTAAGDPRVWGLPIPPRDDIPGDDGGAWSTPALYGDTLFLTTHPGDLLAVDTATGEVRWRDRIGYHEWASPALVVDQGRPVLVTALCEGGGLRAYDVSDTSDLQELWTLPLPTGACIESTPAVWDGGIYVGARDGYLYGVRDGP